MRLLVYLLTLSSFEAFGQLDTFEFRNSDSTIIIITLHVNNTIDEIIPVKNGKIDGCKYKFYENGGVSYQYRYKAGLKDGPFTVFYDNGEPEIEGFYLQGTPVGQHIHYNPGKKIIGIKKFNQFGELEEYIRY